ncbi:DNA repair protein RecO [Inhella gelatinilytica]|uniref:DNA repair protein RecO n=1 Tax=Inhella gelatinilytica TaxID=2795030 RepID=A0A931NDP3_9BURK|nr:DNA repair protein RecO [Inhella gelatinilytica]MBH9553292.1 DNA repair protein RecO [Inhella gelatinilytica]
MKSGGLTAYVLHRYDWSESSLVLDVFTREQGRISVVAKGAKRPTSQLRAVLLPMQRVHLHLTKPKGPELMDIHTLRSAEWAAGHPMPQGDGLLAAYYLNELLLRLLPRGEPHPEVFEPYAAAIAGLALPTETSDSPDAWLRAFELRLLQALGWLPDLTRDSVHLEPLHAAGRYTLTPEIGLVAGEGTRGSLAGANWVAMAHALPGGLHPLVEAVLTLPKRSTLKALLREVLHYHLGHQALRSRFVLHQAHDLLENRP